MKHTGRLTLGSQGAGAYDLYSEIGYNLEPGERGLFSTGVRLQLPIGMAALVLPRSGLAAKHGITVLNAPGLIDSDYRDEIKVILINHGEKPYYINQGDRIAQLRFSYTPTIDLQQVDSIDNDTRRGGFGSTGV